MLSRRVCHVTRPSQRRRLPRSRVTQSHSHRLTTHRWPPRTDADDAFVPPRPTRCAVPRTLSRVAHDARRCWFVAKVLVGRRYERVGRGALGAALRTARAGARHVLPAAAGHARAGRSGDRCCPRHSRDVPAIPPIVSDWRIPRPSRCDPRRRASPRGEGEGGLGRRADTSRRDSRRTISRADNADKSVGYCRASGRRRRCPDHLSRAVGS